jgi:hypothetical protein
LLAGRLVVIATWVLTAPYSGSDNAFVRVKGNELLPYGAAYRLTHALCVYIVARPISSVLKQQSESFTIGVCFGEPRTATRGLQVCPG